MRFEHYYQARLPWKWKSRGWISGKQTRRKSSVMNAGWRNIKEVWWKGVGGWWGGGGVKMEFFCIFCFIWCMKDPGEKCVFQPTLIWSHEQSTQWVSLQAVTDIFGLINPQLGLLHDNQSTWISRRPADEKHTSPGACFPNGRRNLAASLLRLFPCVSTSPSLRLNSGAAPFEVRVVGFFWRVLRRTYPHPPSQ